VRICVIGGKTIQINILWGRLPLIELNHQAHKECTMHADIRQWFVELRELCENPLCPWWLYWLLRIPFWRSAKKIIQLSPSWFI